MTEWLVKRLAWLVAIALSGLLSAAVALLAVGYHRAVPEGQVQCGESVELRSASAPDYECDDGQYAEYQLVQDADGDQWFLVVCRCPELYRYSTDAGAVDASEGG